MDPLKFNNQLANNMRRSLAAVTAVAIAAMIGACADSGALPSGKTSAGDSQSVLSLLERLRPSQGEVVKMVVDSQTQKPSHSLEGAAAGLTPLSDSPTVSAIELHPYLIDPQGNYVKLTTAVTIADLADGTLAIMPYEIFYQDQTTALTGFLELRFEWSGDANLFFAATPPYLVSQQIDAPGAYIRGTVYNSMLDMLLDNVFRNNGQLIDATVYAIDPYQQVYSARLSGDGTYEIGPLPPGMRYVIAAARDSFQTAVASVYLSEPVLIEDFDFDLMPIVTNMHQTGVIYGRVLDLDGDPVGESAVRLLGGSDGAVVESVLGTLANSAGEYILFNIHLPSSVTYVVESRFFAASGLSSSLTIDSAAGQVVERNVVIQNHKSTVTCAAEGQSGQALEITTTVGSQMQLTAFADDLDGDTLSLDWALSGEGAMVPQLIDSGANAKQIVYHAPDYPATVQLAATVSDWASWASCNVTVHVVYPSE